MNMILTKRQNAQETQFARIEYLAERLAWVIEELEKAGYTRTELKAEYVRLMQVVNLPEDVTGT